MLEISLDGNPGIEVELESSKPDGCESAITKVNARILAI
jgi:hypothetical protein